VRHYWANSAVYHLNLWLHTLIELWTWVRFPPRNCVTGVRVSGTMSSVVLRMRIAVTSYAAAVSALKLGQLPTVSS
jgi:hypothetical protein